MSIFLKVNGIYRMHFHPLHEKMVEGGSIRDDKEKGGNSASSSATAACSWASDGKQ